jgi:uncharacterized membrane-anchored protein
MAEGSDGAGVKVTVGTGVKVAVAVGVAEGVAGIGVAVAVGAGAGFAQALMKKHNRKVIDKSLRDMRFSKFLVAVSVSFIVRQ